MFNFCPDTRGRGGLLFRFACSVVLWGGRDAADKCHWPVWGALTVFQPHWVWPRSWCVLSLSILLSSRLLYREWALSCVHSPGPSHSDSGFRAFHKSTDSVGPAFCTFPSPSSAGRQELDELTLPGLQRALSPARSQPQFPLAPVVCALCLFRGSGLKLHPECQEVFV